MILIITQAQSAKDVPNNNSDKQLAQSISQKLSYFQQKEFWSLKIKL
jgi:hypothetical protein